MTGRKLKTYAGLTEIGQTLVKIFILTGLKKDRFPDGDESLFLMNFISKNYENYTLEEIYLAFELAIKRDLDQFLGKEPNVNHYQSFSVEYFCKILTGFRKYKAHNLTPILAKQNKLKEIEEISDYDFLKINFVNKFSIYIQGGYPWNYGIDIKIFELLVKNGIIAIKEDEKIRVGQEVKNQLKSSYKDDKERKNDWIRLTKKRFFMDFIDNCRKEKVNLNELIEKI